MQTTLKINSRGAVKLPTELRRAAGLMANTQLIAETTVDGLLLRSSAPLRLEMYPPRRVREFDEAEAELAQILVKR